jgi:hypothetical protein
MAPHHIRLSIAVSRGDQLELGHVGALSGRRLLVITACTCVGNLKLVRQALYWKSDCEKKPALHCSVYDHDLEGRLWKTILHLEDKQQ